LALAQKHQNSKKEKITFEHDTYKSRRVVVASIVNCDLFIRVFRVAGPLNVAG